MDLRNRIDAELKAVDQLYQNTVLTLGDLNKWLSLRNQVGHWVPSFDWRV